MYINAKRKPQTVKIDMTVFNDDGSKDIITTEALNIEGTNRPLSETWFRYGLDEQFDEPPVDVLKWGRSLAVSKSFFQVELRLAPHSSNKSGIVYQIQHVEAPSNTMIMVYDSLRDKVLICELDEETIYNRVARNSEEIYFEVVIP